MRACRGWRGPITAGALTALVWLGGCYQRVVHARGIGASEVAVREPYAADTALDRLLLGPPPEPPRRKIKKSYWTGG